MRCEACQGKGHTIKRTLVKAGEPLLGIFVGTKNAELLQSFVCTACNGSGFAHCCDGECSQPEEVTHASTSPPAA